jgi:cytohesin
MSRIESLPTILHILVHGRCKNLILQYLKRHPPHFLHNYIGADCAGGYPPKLMHSDWSRTALQVAISGLLPDIVKLLLNQGADVNASHQPGLDHPLHFLTSQESQVGCYRSERRDFERLEVIKTLLRHGVEVDIKDNDGHTALHREASGGRVKIVEMLLQHGADPNAKASDDSTPLHMAAYFLRAGIGGIAYTESVGIARILIQHGTDLDAQDAIGDTALHKAVYTPGTGSRKDMCKLLLEHGADVNARDQEGEISLHRSPAIWTEALTSCTKAPN